jgi:predicted double-glycine peptidase
MRKFNPKLVIVLSLAVGLVSATAISAIAEVNEEYWNQASTILNDLSSDMTQLGNEATSYGNENLSKSQALEKAKQHEKNALNLLERMIRLNPTSPDSTFHAKIVNMVSNWYLAARLWHEGLKEGNKKKMGAVEPIVSVIKEEAKLFRKKAKGGSENNN